MFKHEQTLFDLYEHYHKQYYYNRCLISGPNGILKLTIPVLHKSEKTPIKDVQISYEYNWQTLHWRSIEAAYRRSPYFEFYEHYFVSIFSDFKPAFLFEWNTKLFEIINTILGNTIHFSYTSEYKKTPDTMNDYRSLASPSVLSAQNMEVKKYQQVFGERHGFLNNLSILDLLFCEGNNAKQYLI